MKKILMLLLGILLFGSLLSIVLALDKVTQQVTVTVITAEMNVLSPQQDAIYNDGRVLINVDIEGREADDIKYSDNSKKFSGLCRNCDSYSRKKSFDEGEHELTIKAIFDSEEIFSPTITFFVDSKEPRISKTEPKRNSFVNGSEFYIKYTEDNLQNITLFYGTGTESRTKYDCPIGRNQECVFNNINLTAYNGKTIEYWFEIIDIAGNTDKSRDTKIKVDTTSPVINNPETFWTQGTGRNSKYIYFDMDITEKNFDEVVYTYYDSRGRLKEKRLCSSLRRGVCEKKKSFKKGQQDITLIVRDKAGNSISYPISFEVDY